ncbi:MAG: adenylosuccinate lyase [Candidatus Thermoplasmatota archaeon]|jgi:adenylosuccinate lyase|nr:adenylosuccinate lyase [Candidatus Thermoplasmatota archaeon]MCL5790869.1 adenylosuccinate lyase [Candidatus Thermoplasmatota archaeon]
MIVSPIDSRYGRDQVKSIFDIQNRYNLMLKVEIEALRAQIAEGVVPELDLDPLLSVLEHGVDARRVSEIEKETHHDIMAFIRTVSEQSGSESSFLHFGLTSNDIIDTVTALQIKDFYDIIYSDIFDMEDILIALVRKYSKTPMLGRTHGQHASPITFGLKAATWLEEFSRHLQRLEDGKKRILVGKTLGPVGTGASMGRKGLQVSLRCMTSLGLSSEVATGQLVARDRYIEFLQILSGISVTLDKIGTEIRNLQRPEINEVMEFFDSRTQVGSSAMPSKRNPIESENVCSLSRFIRSLVTPESESAVTWHERDLTNSALERFTIPYSCILSDYIITKMTRILKNLKVNASIMQENLDKSQLCISERLTSELTMKGVDRQAAHEIVRRISMKFYEEDSNLAIILESGEFGKYFSHDQILNIVNPDNFLGSSDLICDKAIENALKQREGLK